MKRLLPVVLVALLAGCTQADTGAPSRTDALSTAAGGPHDPAGASPDGGREPTAENATPEPFHLEGVFYAKAMLPGLCERELTPGCSAYAHEVSHVAFEPALNRSQVENATFSEWVFTATWSPAQPAAATVYLRVVDEATETTLGMVKGTSPLELRVPRDQMTGTGAYRATIAPTEGGAFYEQSVTVALDMQ